MVLNKKQQIIGWIMITLMSLVILRAILVLPNDTYFNIKISLALYFIILILGFPLIYYLRDKKN